MKTIIILFLIIFQSCCASGDDLKQAYDLGIIAFNNGDIKNAKIILKHLVEQTNDYPIAFYVLGKIYKLDNNLAESLNYFEKAYDFSPKNSKLRMYSLIMQSYLLDNDVNKALEKAREAIEIDKNDPDAKFAYAMALNNKAYEVLKSEKPNKLQAINTAITLYKESIKWRGDIHLSVNSLASCYLELIEMGVGDKNQLCQQIKKLLDFFKTRKTNYKNYLSNKSRFERVCN